LWWTIKGIWPLCFSCEIRSHRQFPVPSHPVVVQNCNINGNTLQRYLTDKKKSRGEPVATINVQVPKLNVCLIYLQ